MVDNMKKKKKNPILRLLFAVVIPLIIIVAIVVTIMEVAGFNVMDWTKHQASTIPVISNLVASEKAAPVQNDSHEQAIVDEKDGEITSLNETIRELEATINEQKRDIVRLENSLETALEDGESSEKNSPDDSLTSIIDSFEEMKGSKAAPIVENLETDTAVAILQELSKDHRASILSSMDPEKAAKLTQLFFSSAN